MASNLLKVINNDQIDILIVAPVWLGDAVCSNTAIKIIRYKYPYANIVVLATANLTDLFERMVEVNDIIVTNFAHSKLNLFERYRLGKQLKTKYKFKISFILQNSLKAGLIPFFANIPNRIGFATEMRHLLGIVNHGYQLPKFWKMYRIVDRMSLIATDGRQLSQDIIKYFYPKINALNTASIDDYISSINNVHAQSMLSAILNHCCKRQNTSKLHAEYNIKINQANVNHNSQAQINQHNTNQNINNKAKIAIFAIGAAYGIAKMWPIEYFAQLGVKLAHDNYNVIILGNQQESKLAEQMIQIVNNDQNNSLFNQDAIVNLCGLLSIKEIIDLLPYSDVFIGNDSGLSHLAAATTNESTKIICLFGSTHPKHSAPVGHSNQLIFYQNMSCSPCYKKTCKFNHYKCLRDISVNQVYYALLQ